MVVQTLLMSLKQRNPWTLIAEATGGFSSGRLQTASHLSVYYIYIDIMPIKWDKFDLLAKKNQIIRQRWIMQKLTYIRRIYCVCLIKSEHHQRTSLHLFAVWLQVVSNHKLIQTHSPELSALHEAKLLKEAGSTIHTGTNGNAGVWFQKHKFQKPLGSTL